MAIVPSGARIAPAARHSTTPQQSIQRQPETTAEDRGAAEESLRPRFLREYIGQTALKQVLQIAVDAARQREEPLDHLLLYGPPGLGKTTMAMVLAAELEAHCRIASAPALERPRDIIGLLMTLRQGGMLFLDEIHRLPRVAEELLYPAMEDFRLDLSVGKGASARTRHIPLPRFTLVGATTRAGALSSPLRDRFGLLHRLDFYTHDELCRIVCRSALLLGMAVEPNGAAAVASRCRGTPRIANRLLRRIRDYALVKQCSSINEAVVVKALAMHRIDHLGLDPSDHGFLKTIALQFSGGPVGLSSLSAALGEDANTLESVVEPYLLRIGFLQRTPQGRRLSPQAYSHLGLATPPSVATRSVTTQEEALPLLGPG